MKDSQKRPLCVSPDFDFFEQEAIIIGGLNFQERQVTELILIKFDKVSSNEKSLTVIVFFFLQVNVILSF